MPPGDRPRAVAGPRPQALERCAGHARSGSARYYTTDAAAAGRRRAKGGDGRARALRRDAAQAARGLYDEVAITKVQASAAVSTRNGFEDLPLARAAPGTPRRAVAAPRFQGIEALAWVLK